MNVVDKAIMAAYWFHDTHTDMAGKPYTGHLRRVAKPFAEPNRWDTACAVAWLHDIVEDTDCTLADLYELGFPDEIVHAVDAITQREGENLDDYWARVKANPIARAVKVKGDIPDNSDPMRLEFLPPHLQEKLTLKYRRALEALGYDD
jgi:(p)ppGpp synthase/HD superfamily hydrolase